MKKIVFALFLVLSAVNLLAGAMPPEDELKTLEAKVDKLMAAYNEGVPKAFYADFAKSISAFCTPQNFKMIFVDHYMKNFGAYKSRKIIETQTVVNPDSPNGLLVYIAQFEKNASVKLAINLFKEDGEWRFQQVTIQPM
ncbi:MAG: hypothetical protein Kow0029_09850 [Candidatus Rifleibacteriota bacterium]